MLADKYTLDPSANVATNQHLADGSLGCWAVYLFVPSVLHRANGTNQPTYAAFSAQQERAPKTVTE